MKNTNTKHAELTQKIAHWGKVSHTFSHYKTIKTPMLISVYITEAPEAQATLLSKQMNNDGFQIGEHKAGKKTHTNTSNELHHTHEISYSHGSSLHKHVFVKPEHAQQYVNSVEL